MSIHVQGCFVGCAAPGVEAGRVAAALLELVSAPQVHAHAQPFVRRSALVALAQARGRANLRSQTLKTLVIRARQQGKSRPRC